MAEVETLTQGLVRQLLDYDPETGVFAWRDRDQTVPKNRSWNSRYAGKAAGAKKASTGYIVISIHDKNWLAHRLAFLWMIGRLPFADVDHANGRRDDNRWANLRDATRQENCWNVEGYGASKRRGVTFHKRDNKFQALIRIDGRNKSLGYFDSAGAAEVAYNTAAQKQRGEFAHNLR